MLPRRQKNLVLILAREFASKLATATFITDDGGRLVFYNEPAEEILGRTFAEAGEMSADEWASLFAVEELDGTPMALEQMPGGIALLERRPAHHTFRITGLNGRRRVISATAFPLYEHEDSFVGVVVIFWEHKEQVGWDANMRVKVWGSRGSLATPGRDTLRYGGNTPCVEVRLADRTLIVLDAGTGIRRLGLDLDGETARIHLLLTHLHLDHLEGLPFFLPLWRRETELHVWGPPSPLKSLHERVARYFSPPLFPVELTEAPARIRFHDAPEEGWEIGSARLFTEPVEHPGPTVGYRIEEGSASLAYIPDHEPALAGDLERASPEWISGFTLAERASVLLHDSQFFEHEYESRVGWGHSSVAHAVAFARASSTERLVLFHHDPLHVDDELEALRDRARELWGQNGAGPELAHEGMEIALG